jgi:hypothetical protein
MTDLLKGAEDDMDSQRASLEKELYRLYGLSRIKEMTDKNRADVLTKIDKLEDMLEDDYEEVHDEDEVTMRKEVLKENKGLRDIFSAIWFCCNEHVDGGVLRMQGFAKFYLILSKALGSYFDSDEGESRLMEKALFEYVRNVKLYNSDMTRDVFNDVLFKIIERHTEFIDPMYYSAFAWSLLDSMTDLSKQPPQFRPLRTVTQFMKADGEAKMLTSYLDANAQSQIVKLTVSNDWMERVPDVMQRIGARKKAGAITQNDIQMVAIIANKLRRERIKERENLLSDSESGDDDSDEDFNDEKQKKKKKRDKDKESGLERKFEKVFETNFDVDAFKDRRRTLRKLGVSRADWLDKIDPNMPLTELTDARDNFGEKIQKSKFGTWVAGTGTNKDKITEVLRPEKEDSKPKKATSKTFHAGGAAGSGWSNEDYLVKRNRMKLRMRLARTSRVVTPSPQKTAPEEAKVDVLSGTATTAGTQEMFPTAEEDGNDSFDEERDKKYHQKALDDEENFKNGDFNTQEWATFRKALRTMKKDDAKSKKRVAKEKDKITVEIAKRRENMREEMESYQAAKRLEEERKRLKQLAEEKEEQDYIDGLVAFVDPSLNVAAHPADSINFIQHPHPDITEDYEQGPVEYKLEEPTPLLLATHAIDDASQFDPNFDEQYELDSFFSMSGARSVDTGLSSEQLLEALIAAATGATVKKQRQINKMAATVLADEQQRGKWGVLAPVKPKVRHMKETDNRPVSSATTAPSFQQSVSISMPKTNMEEEELQAATNPVGTFARSDSVNDLSVVSGSEYGSIGNVKQFGRAYMEEGDTVGHIIPDGKSSPAQRTSSAETSKLINLSQSLYLVSAGDDDVGVINSASLSRQASPTQKTATLEPKDLSLPFPHKSFSTLVESVKVGSAARGEPGAGDGNLGVWNHERAASLQLLTKKPLRDESTLLLPDNINTSKALDALKIERRELPWFRSDLPTKVRGRAYNPNNPAHVPEPQRSVIRPGYTRALLGSTGGNMLQSNSKHTTDRSLPGIGSRDGDCTLNRGNSDKMLPSKYSDGMVHMPHASVMSLDSASMAESIDFHAAAASSIAVNANSKLNLNSSIQAATEVPHGTCGEEGTLYHPAKSGLLAHGEDGDGQDIGRGMDGRVMTGLEPPQTAGDSFVGRNIPTSVTTDPELFPSMPLSIVVEPLLPSTSKTMTYSAASNTRLHNDLVKNMIRNSQRAMSESPEHLSPEFKNPAKPVNLVDGSVQNVATGFLKEPMPIPSPNRPKPLHFGQPSDSLLVKKASFSLRDELADFNGGGYGDEEDNLLAPLKVRGNDDIYVDEDNGGDDEGSLLGEKSVVSILTADEPQQQMLSPLATLPVVALAQSPIGDIASSIMRDSLDSSQVKSALFDDSPKKKISSIKSSSSNALPAVEKSTPSLVVRSYRYLPVTTEGSITASMTGGESNLTVTDSVEQAVRSKELTQEAIMLETFTSEAEPDPNAISSASLLTGHTASLELLNSNIVAAVERNIDAIAPPRPDPLGPASKMGLASLELHPRFKCTGLPGPSREPVPHLMSSTVHSRLPDKYIDIKTERIEKWAAYKKMLRNKGGGATVTADSLDKLGIEKDRSLLTGSLDLTDTRVTSQIIQGQPPPFWLPKGIRKAADSRAHDRSSHLNGWAEVKMLLDNDDVKEVMQDRAASIITIKRQEAFLERFKDYSMLTSMRESNPDWVKFKYRNEELVPVGKNTKLHAFEGRFEGKRLPPKIGKFVPWKKKTGGDNASTQ